MFELISRSLRSLRRSPGFLAIAAISLGTAMGASTAVFAFIDTVTHPVLAFAHPEQLRTAWLRFGITVRTPSLLEQMRALQRIDGFAGVTGARPSWAPVVVTDVVRQDLVLYSAPNYFDVLGVKPRLGRLPTDAEREAGSAALVSNTLWHAEFGNRKVIGDAHLSVDGQVYAVVGVLPPGFKVTLEPDVIIPLWSENQLESKQFWGRTPVVRLKPDADSAKITAQLALLAAQYTISNSNPDRPYAYQFSPFKNDPLRIAGFQQAMLAATLALLLIACANVAALLLARGVIRRRDYALRLALGASRTTLGLEVLAEVAVVTIVSGAIGAVFATWGVGVLTSFLPTEFTWLGILEPKWSVRVFAASLGMGAAAIAVAGAVPAWLVTRVQPNEPLKDSAGTTTGRAGTRFKYLVMGELAISMALLLCASLLSKGTRNIAEYDFGYDARSLMEVAFMLPPSKGPAEVPTLTRASAITEKVRAIPGVAGAAVVGRMGADNFEAISDVTVAGGDGIRLNDGYFDADAGFFRTLGLRVTEGRDFLDGDRTGEGAAILSRSAAKALFPHSSAIGRRVKMGDFKSARPWLRVVGIVDKMRFDFRGNDRDFDDEPMIVTSTAAGVNANYWQMVIRPVSGAKAVDVAVQREMRADLPPAMRVTVSKWMANYANVLRGYSFISSVFAFIGLLSLALGAAGLFSVLSYVVGQRMREFAVRMALGADRPRVIKLVLRSAFELALGGTAIGAFFGMWTGALLSAMLTNVKPTDAGALITAEAVLIVVTMLASLLPALRAARANPVDVLRAS